MNENSFDGDLLVGGSQNGRLSAVRESTDSGCVRQPFRLIDQPQLFRVAEAIPGVQEPRQEVASILAGDWVGDGPGFGVSVCQIVSGRTRRAGMRAAFVAKRCFLRENLGRFESRRAQFFNPYAVELEATARFKPHAVLEDLTAIRRLFRFFPSPVDGIGGPVLRKRRAILTSFVNFYVTGTGKLIGCVFASTG